MCKSREAVPLSLHFWNLPTLPDGFFKTHIDKFHEKNFPVLSVSDPNPDPHSMGSWIHIRIRMANAEPNSEPEGGKSAQNEEKLSVKTRKNYKISIFCVIGKELGLKMFNVRKIR
jgi:hypothetical protein